MTEQTGAAGATGASGEGTGTTPPAGTAAGTGTTPPPPPAGTETPEQAIQRLTEANARLEREKADARVAKEGALKENAKKSQLYALAKTLDIEGLKPEGEETLDSLQQKITGRVVAGDQNEADKVEAREAKVELAVYKQATAEGIDANRLTNSRSFYAAIKNLDPASAGFEQSLGTAIAAEVTKDPTLKGAQGSTGGTGGTKGEGPGASGAQNHGGSGGGQSQVTQEAFDAMSMVEKNRLFLTDREQFDKLVG